MSKIQEYVDAKAISDELAALAASVPSDTRSCIFNPTTESAFSPLMLNIKLSPTAAVQTTNMGTYLALAIQNALTTLMASAVDLAEADTETARVAAVDEAHEVLKDLE